MAQVLKPEIKEQILKQAKAELLQYGFQNASMRRIAQNCGLSVGNLYRYFDSKEALKQAVIGETKQKINDIAARYSDNNLSLFSQNYNWKPPFEELESAMEHVSDDIMTIYHENQDELIIILQDDNEKTAITDWIKGLVVYVMNGIFSTSKDDPVIKIISDVYTESFIQGIETLVLADDISEDVKAYVLKLYFHSFVTMIQTDINKVVRN